MTTPEKEYFVADMPKTDSRYEPGMAFVNVKHRRRTRSKLMAQPPKFALLKRPVYESGLRSALNEIRDSAQRHYDVAVVEARRVNPLFPKKLKDNKRIAAMTSGDYITERVEALKESFAQRLADGEFEHFVPDCWSPDEEHAMRRKARYIIATGWELLVVPVYKIDPVEFDEETGIVKLVEDA
ncbi:MAG: hypothetical protein AAF583_08100 [Pseudomonadota bacterium]